MNTIRAIFFDAVGTLIHPEPAAHLVYAEAGRRFGSRFSPDNIARRFGPAFQKQETIDRHKGWITSEQREWERWRGIVGEVLDDVADPASCFDFLYNHFAKPDSWRCEPGLTPLFEELQARGYQLGLASNFDARLYALVHGLKPLHFFGEPRDFCEPRDIGERRGVSPPVSVVSFEVGFRKPAPEFFQIMSRRAGLDAGLILHVGDDPENDYAGAQAAGMAAVLYDPWGKFENWHGKSIQTLTDLWNFV